MLKVLNHSGEVGHSLCFSGVVSPCWCFWKTMCLLAKAWIETLERLTWKLWFCAWATTFIFRHYIHCLCVVIWSFPTGVFLFFKKIIDLLFTISYTCNIVFPPSKLSTIGEVSTFLNKMLANINGRNRSFCKSNSFICGLSWEGQDFASYL